MSKKQIDTSAIENELAGSVFFRKREQQRPTLTSPAKARTKEGAQSTPVPPVPGVPPVRVVPPFLPYPLSNG
jgi:hypothetical protein